MVTGLSDIRQAFLGFFEENQHHIVPSAPLVPHNDPTLMFTNAGMVPFKHVFSGRESLRGTDGEVISRAASSQKCVRAGGKHNDLDNVGYTARHHTFFEMLGNFSFGDYFKEEAIVLAWNFLTKTLDLPKDRLYATVYHTDDEAFNLWKSVAGLSDDRIIRIATNDNFWSMGDTGPCGPCSEIFYDHGEQIAGGLPGTPEEDGDRFVEIWNLVFMQYEKLADGRQIDLPKPCIDTGMGLERMATVMQGIHNNYETDLFQHLIAASQEASGNSVAAHLVSHRVIADHLRSCAFLLADGVMPSNEGRGYVLRRIMRRAMRHAHMLGCREPLMYRLVPALVEEMGAAYPELVRARELIIDSLQQEESRFKETLERGLDLLEKETSALRQGDKLDGEVAFRLYDTYGFPLDLTQDILRGKKMEVDNAAFDAAMAEQKRKARAAWKGSGEQATEEVWFDIQEQHGATEFLGYDTTRGNGEVVALIVEGQRVSAVKAGDEVALVVNQTPFYGESGGQAGDVGIIRSENGLEMRVTDTQKKLGNIHVHVGEVLSGTLTAGDVVELDVDVRRRDGLRANHSATHLLHAVLREVLGEHVTQKGSLVEQNYLRFDFSHSKGVSREELQEIEAKVNALIDADSPVSTALMTPDEAIKKGAMALFGEKYGDEVRVLSMGEGYSVELCGGTHVAKTGDIGACIIQREGSVSSGVRRIEACAGLAVLEEYKAAGGAVSTSATHAREAISETERAIGKPIEIHVRELEAAQAQQAEAEREAKKAREKAEREARAKTLANASQQAETEEVAGITFVGQTLEDVPAKELRGMTDSLKKQIGSGVVTIIASNEGKAAIVVGVTEDLTAKINAVDLVREGSAALGGKGGGGRPDFAQAGGSDASKADEALSAIRQALGKF